MHGGNSMSKRRPFKQTQSLHDRLAARTEKVRLQAPKLPPGSEGDGLIANSRRPETASRLEAWVKSPGLRPPK